MKLTAEQIEKILSGAPDGATKFATYIDEYYFKPAIPHGLKLYSPFVNKWQWVRDCSMLRSLQDLADLREILELRQEVERLNATIAEMSELCLTNKEVWEIQAKAVEKFAKHCFEKENPDVYMWDLSDVKGEAFVYANKLREQGDE